MMQQNNNAESYADLLKARGDIPITVLREMHKMMGDLIALMDTLDESLEVKPAPNQAEQAIAAALRAKYPDFAGKSDAEVLAYFGVTVGGNHGN